MKDLLTKVFSALQNAKIEYVILRKFEFLPERMIDGDIDLLVSRNDVSKIKFLLSEMGFLIAPDIFPHSFAFFFNGTDGNFIKLDIIDRLAFGKKLTIPFPPYYEQLVLNRKVFSGAFFIPSSEDEILLFLLHCIGNKASFKQYYKERLKKLVGLELDRRYLDKYITKIFGKNASRTVFSCIYKGNFEQLLSFRKSLKLFLFKKMNLRSFATTLTIFYQRVVRKLLGRRGLTIALLGPDGSGKTTLAKNIMNRQFFNTKYVYMGRDQFLIPTRRILKYIITVFSDNPSNIDKTTTLSKQETLIPVSGRFRDFLDVFRFFHDLIDYYMRYFMYNYLPYKEGILVVNDRYIYDMLSSGEKVQSLSFFRWIIIKLFPVPDFTFVLNAPAEKMYERKGEHSFVFLQSMQLKYNKLNTVLKNCHLIQTDVNIEESANKIISLIWHNYFRNLAEC